MKAKYMFNVPLDEEGELFLKLFDKYLNKKSYSFRRRARGARTEAALKDGRHPRAYDTHLPVKHAQRFQLYLQGPTTDEHESIWNLERGYNELVEENRVLEKRINLFKEHEKRQQERIDKCFNLRKAIMNIIDENF